jgi:hypothetical protein
LVNDHALKFSCRLRDGVAGTTQIYAGAGKVV